MTNTVMFLVLLSVKNGQYAHCQIGDIKGQWATRVELPNADKGVFINEIKL